MTSSVSRDAPFRQGSLQALETALIPLLDGLVRIPELFGGLLLRQPLPKQKLYEFPAMRFHHLE
jgi:hypothetical protein